jgi:hypothetical protein
MPKTAEIDNRGVPVLAGICSYEEASRPGLSVDASVTLLKRHNHVLRRLHEIGAAHLPSTPEWEVKCGLGLHLWLDAEHCSAIRARVSEMREPPLRLDDVPDDRLEAALAEAIRARGTAELLGAVYGAVRPALIAALEEHLRLMNPLFDHPTRRVLRGVLREQEEILEWGVAALEATAADPESAALAASFAEHVGAHLAAAGGVSGREAAPSAPPPTPRSDGSRYVMDSRPQRDPRFTEQFNCSADIDAYYLDESRTPDERVLALLYKRLREMDVPEWMAPIIYQTQGRPWPYYADLSRQLWDEIRHAMMGQVGLEARGIPFHEFPVDMTTSVVLNESFSPLDAHLVLWRIEQDLMPRTTGKRFEYQLAQAADDALAVAMQDYDWADEVLHAQIGRRQLAHDFPTTGDRAAAADAAWARFQEISEEWRAQHRTDRPWWPDLVTRARASGPAADRDAGA